MAQEIRKFLWKGGKSNIEKYHLVNCKIVRAPKDRGGLGIKNPSLMNLFFCAKIIWRLVASRLEWWKKVSCKKYFNQCQKIIIDGWLDNKKGSHIWKLLKVCIPYNPLQNHLDP
jgi:hypothetical protein